MVASGLIARVVFVAVLLNCCFAPDNLWLGMHFVWGSPSIEVESAGE